MTPMKNRGLGSLLSVTSSKELLPKRDLERPSVSSVGRKVKTRVEWRRLMILERVKWTLGKTETVGGLILVPPYPDTK